MQAEAQYAGEKGKAWITQRLPSILNTTGDKKKVYK